MGAEGKLLERQRRLQEMPFGQRSTKLAMSFLGRRGLPDGSAVMVCAAGTDMHPAGAYMPDGSHASACPAAQSAAAQHFLHLVWEPKYMAQVWYTPRTSDP